MFLKNNVVALGFNLSQQALFRNLALFSVCLVILLQMIGETRAQTFNDSGFVTEVVITLPAYEPAGLTFAPDGRMFIWQQNGIIRIYKNGTLLQTPFLDVRSRVNTVNDRGMLGFALDPNFATNNYFYLLYTYEPNNNPNDSGPKTNRLTRMKADPENPDVALPSSETVILGSISNTPCLDNTDCIGSEDDSHSVGTIRFANDGKMFVSLGDGASYNYADSLALRSQNLDRFEGKILRINPDGSAPIDNPFYNGSNATRSKIYSYGLRNPYRFALHPTTNQPYIGDVGWNMWEEINTGGAGKNFGWPCFEGNEPQSSYQASFEQCRNLPASAVASPIYSYPHAGASAAVIGGAFYTSIEFPQQYRGNYFFADYAQDWIRRMVFDSNGNVVNVQNFASNLNGVVTIETGPDGALYYIALETGEVRRIRYGNVPVAVAAATPTTVTVSVPVNFTSQGSNNPNGGELTYLWEFGDGETSALANPTHVYANPGIYSARLTITNQQGSSAQTSLTITVNNNANSGPTATILTPNNGASFTGGQTVNFSGSAFDPNETLPASAMSWQVLLHHDNHVHPYLTAIGTSGSFVVENHGQGTYYYEIILTVTDSGGLSNTKNVNVNVVNTLPTVAMTAPANNAAYAAPANIVLTANAADADGQITTVEFYSNGTLLGTDASAPYSFAWNNVAAGNYNITAKAYDNSVASAISSATSIVVVNNAPVNSSPTIVIISPANNADFTAPASVTFNVNAADSDGTITKVEFYSDGALIGTKTTAPYNFTWSNVPKGNYKITAKAYDNAGATAISNEVKIKVKNGKDK